MRGEAGWESGWLALESQEDLDSNPTSDMHQLYGLEQVTLLSFANPLWQKKCAAQEFSVQMKSQVQRKSKIQRKKNQTLNPKSRALNVVSRFSVSTLSLKHRVVTDKLLPSEQ